MASKHTARKSGGGKSGKNRKKQNRKSSNASGAAFVLVPAVLFALALFLLLTMLHGEWTGVVGACIREWMLGLLGGGYYVLPLLLVLQGIFFSSDKENHALGLKTIFGLAVLFFFAALMHVIRREQFGAGNLTVQQLYALGVSHTTGGVIGGILGSILLKCGVAGAWIICVLVIGLCGLFYCGTTPLKLIGDLHYAFVSGRDKHESRAEENAKRDEDIRRQRAEQMAQMQADHRRRRQEKQQQKREMREERQNRRTADIDRNIYAGEESDAQPTSAVQEQAQQPSAQEVLQQDDTTVLAPEAVGGESAQENKWNLDDILGNPKKAKENKAEKDGTDAGDGLAVQVSDLTENAEEQLPAAYAFPPMSFLHQETEQLTLDGDSEVQENADKLVATLRSFRVNTKIINISRGPTITRYELAPEAGTRVRSISNLVDDIALSLATTGVRIESPIPGKAAVGIEVPNKTVSTVYVRDLMEKEAFTAAKSKLTTCLGMDVAGAPVYLDIAKMPHLLIAGATGMGKSVCINSLIVSILYKATPDEVKLILIDPKKVELNIYNGIPHLMVPVVSDPKKAAGSLHWAVSEMERRFEQIEGVGVRDIAAYNAITRDDPEKEPMSQIVIIIDELADLMMTAPVEVEESICRLAQKARAAGMHLIIGTQRPSVDVITGLIKANIPSRIAFTVASQVDSRTILDIAGAEKLIGRGDMLYAPVGMTKPLRVQGAFVSEKEIEKITGFLKKNAGEIEYDEEVVKLINRAAELCGNKKGKAGTDTSGNGLEGEIAGDPKLKEAIDLAVQNGTISTSLLQRKLSLGYGRAAKILDAMQERGIVSAPEGQKPRTVLISRAQWEQIQMGGGSENGGEGAAFTDEKDSLSDAEGGTPTDGEELPWEN